MFKIVMYELLSKVMVGGGIMLIAQEDLFFGGVATFIGLDMLYDANFRSFFNV